MEDNKQEQKYEQQENQKEEQDQQLSSQLLGSQTREVGLGGILGYCSGYFTRQQADKILYYAGGAFVALQLLAYWGYVRINMNKIEKDVVQQVDMDNDGKITTNDFKIMFDKYFKVIISKIPSTITFSAFFLIGFKGSFRIL